MKSIAVFCGASLGNDKQIIAEAYRLGKLFAEKEIVLVYGAAKIGIMGEVSKAVLDNNGKVIGVIPEFLKTKEVFSSGLSELIITKTMHERKELMYDRSEGFMIIPGGFGTLDEFFEIATWGQLGLHSKPIGILNTNGYYDALILQCKTMVDCGFLKKENLDAIIVNDDIEVLLDKMNNFKPLPVPKWLNRDRL